MSNTLAFLITRASTPQRLVTFMDTVKGALATAGAPFDLIVHCLTPESSLHVPDLPQVVGVKLREDNVGQHVIMNEMIEYADAEGYDYLLRLDDDVKFLTKGWFEKMLHAASTLGENFLLSPVVRGLMYPPERTERVVVKGIPLRFLTEAIGGICRLHAVGELCNPEHPYRADVRQPLGYGDATGIAKWAIKHKVWMAYLDGVEVKHAKGTRGQVQDDPLYHAFHDVAQCVPYIPVWKEGGV